MELRAIGIDLGKTPGSSRWDGRDGKRGRAQAMLAQTTARLHGEPARGADRHGALRRGAFPRPCVARARPRCAADAGPVCQIW
jgi:hypothetical protein